MRIPLSSVIQEQFSIQSPVLRYLIPSICLSDVVCMCPQITVWQFRDLASLANVVSNDVMKATAFFTRDLIHLEKLLGCSPRRARTIFIHSLRMMVMVISYPIDPSMPIHLFHMITVSHLSPCVIQMPSICISSSIVMLPKSRWS